MTTPTDTLHLMSDYASRLQERKYNPMFGQYLAHGVFQQYQDTGLEVTMDQCLRAVSWAAASINYAKTYYVSPEMSALIEHALKMVDDSDIADRDIVPNDYGFCYFDGGVALSPQIRIHAIQWFKTKNGDYVFFMYNDMIKEPDHRGAQLLKTYGEMGMTPSTSWAGRWALATYGGYGHGNIIGKANTIGMEPDELRDMLNFQYEDKTIDKIAGSEFFVNPAALVHALFLMLGQTIVSESKVKAGKKLTTRLDGKKLPSEVSVIRLRHSKSEIPMEHDAGSFDYSHRWIVSGFWRWQPHKNELGEWARKRIWIAPHVKGPADKPLILKDKVYALTK